MGSNRQDRYPRTGRARDAVDYAAVFLAVVTPLAVITPDLTVADANEAYLATVERTQEEVIGTPLFELLPPDGTDKRAVEGPEALRSSLLEVLRTGKPDVMDVLRYPVRDQRTGKFRDRFFAPVNVPILDGSGHVALVLHHAEEVTSYVGGDFDRARGLAGGSVPPGYAHTRDLVRRNRRLALQASHDRVVSRVLQDAMLTALPEPDDLALVARYIANTEADQVGGDWYDAAVLPSGSTMVAIGDVVGHDIRAAAGMGQLRGLLRALAWDREESPASILTRVDRAMPGLRIDTLATAILGSIESLGTSGSRQLRWSNAGHPPPLLVAGDGTVEILETDNDLPLGAGLGTPRSDHIHRLAPGSTLFFYTDGLVERRNRSREVGVARLSGALRRCHHLPLDEILDEVIAAVAGNAPEDDIAVLAICVAPTDRSSESEPHPRGGPAGAGTRGTRRARPCSVDSCVSAEGDPIPRGSA